MEQIFLFNFYLKKIVPWINAFGIASESAFFAPGADQNRIAADLFAKRLNHLLGAFLAHFVAEFFANEHNVGHIA